MDKCGTFRLQVREEAFSDFCDFNVPIMSDFKLPA